MFLTFIRLNLYFQSAMKAIEQSEQEPSLTELVQRWLERTPGLELDGFNFWGKYQNAVQKLLDEQIMSAEVKGIVLLYFFMF